MMFDKNTDINKQFKFLATIGKGAYGSVFLVESAITKEEIYALKVLKYMDSYQTSQEKNDHEKNLQQEL